MKEKYACMSMKIFDFHAFNEKLEKLGGAPKEMIFFTTTSTVKVTKMMCNNTAKIQLESSEFVTNVFAVNTKCCIYSTKSNYKGC